MILPNDDHIRANFGISEMYFYDVAVALSRVLLGYEFREGLTVRLNSE